MVVELEVGEDIQMQDSQNTRQANEEEEALSHSEKCINKVFQFSEEADSLVREEKPWKSDAKYFKKLMVASNAGTKMLEHAVEGVEKGRKKNGMPIEIMGLLLGRPANKQDVSASGISLNSIIITDAFALPVEGTETRVLADDDNITNFMISLAESLEKTRKERIIGWYHSHPFDYDPTMPSSYNHCFLSGVDVSTQWMWQRSEDIHGNPWVAVVVDPLSSLARNKPQFGAFRALFESARGEQVAPDGTKVTKENHSKIIKRWCETFNSYHTLEIEFFSDSSMKGYIEKTMDKVSWINGLILSGDDSFSLEAEENEVEKLKEIAEKVQHFKNVVKGGSMFMDVSLKRKKRHLEHSVGEMSMDDHASSKMPVFDRSSLRLNEVDEIQSLLKDLIKTREICSEILGSKIGLFQKQNF